MAEPFARDRGEGRVANRAPRALRRIANFQNLGQPFRARGFERGVRPRMMKIVRGPNRVLFAFFARAAVTTARTASL